EIERIQFRENVFIQDDSLPFFLFYCTCLSQIQSKDSRPKYVSLIFVYFIVVDWIKRLMREHSCPNIHILVTRDIVDIIRHLFSVVKCVSIREKIFTEQSIHVLLQFLSVPCLCHFHTKPIL